MTLNRREALKVATASASAALLGMTNVAMTNNNQKKKPAFTDVGVIIYPWEISDRDWPATVSNLGMHTIALHSARRLDIIVNFIESKEGRQFLQSCQKHSINVEYELHALSDLLSRELFYKDPTMFRLDRFGRRNQDKNCCPTSSAAIEIISENVVKYSRILKPTTGRYFYWTDDASDWCQCKQCIELTSADQATLLENAMVSAIQEHVDSNATLAHLAYQKTLEPPRNIKPHPGLFVELAPSRRSYNQRIGDRKIPLTTRQPRPNYNAGYLDSLGKLQALFGVESTQILEYWLDASYFSRWQPIVKKLPWAESTIREDAIDYRDTGAKHVRTFALWLGHKYTKEYGPAPLSLYAEAMKQKN